MKMIVAMMLACTLAGCGACYREDRIANGGTWPSSCADRFDSPRPK